MGILARWQVYKLAHRYLQHSCCNGRPGTSTDSDNNIPNDPSRGDRYARRLNEMGIPMIPQELRKVLFPDATGNSGAFDGQLITKYRSQIKRLLELNEEELGTDTPCFDTMHHYDTVLRTLPKIHGENLDAHFKSIAGDLTNEYKALAMTLANSQAPSMPEQWEYVPGWTKYPVDSATGRLLSSVSVPYPDADAMVFDVEVCVTAGKGPVIATAVSPTAWYSWCSESLFQITETSSATDVSLDSLMPLEAPPGSSSESVPKRRRIAVGHNVSFDRIRVREQYFLERTDLRFLDTMSMHIAVCGLAGDQRVLYNAVKSDRFNTRVAQDALKYNKTNFDWADKTCGNSLAAVHELHCDRSTLKLDKTTRNVFVTGTMDDVRNDFQNLMSYCANDTLATLEVFQAVVPRFFERFPHPVSFAGTLEMGTAYLPINSNWPKYIDKSDEAFEIFENTTWKALLKKLAVHQVHLIRNNAYQKDPWLWDEDWDKRSILPKSAKTFLKNQSDAPSLEQVVESIWAYSDPRSSPSNQSDAPSHEAQTNGEEHSTNTMATVDWSTNLPGTDHMYFGYPQWFRQLCPKLAKETELPTGEVQSVEEIFTLKPNPTEFSARKQITSKLLKLTWDGYPLYYDKSHGWGYVVPNPSYLDYHRTTRAEQKMYPENPDGTFECMLPKGVKKALQQYIFPFREILAIVEKNHAAKPVENMLTPEYISELFNIVKKRQTSDQTESKPKSKYAAKFIAEAQKSGFRPNVTLPGCLFWKLPHKNGLDKNVGSPMTKDFTQYVESGQLSSDDPALAKQIIESVNSGAYWRSIRDRIHSQIPVWFHQPIDTALPSTVTEHPEYEAMMAGKTEHIPEPSLGAIVPGIVVSGTVTRRAVDRTWLIASNPVRDRVGSEHKQMIQAPPGYRFVGADVDSQELWIASVIGDHRYGLHGATPSSWMLLRGDKAKGTDQHSMVAQRLEISRHAAKVINYGRIYGAGYPFVVTLLCQFNRSLTKDSAMKKASELFKLTKGRRSKKLCVLNDYGISELSRSNEAIIHQLGIYDPIRVAKEADLKTWCHASSTSSDSVTGWKAWSDGTESEMFNALEAIARSQAPSTPVLKGRISEVLEPHHVGDDFLPTRINWVVQSSAVDYLHILLTGMQWLFREWNIRGRLSISIHDEVRYLVAVPDVPKAALALQLANLLTRAYFSHQLGLQDLPESVAFFSGVDVDRCLRKDPADDAVTPSNPKGLSAEYGIPPGVVWNVEEVADHFERGTVGDEHPIHNETDHELIPESLSEHDLTGHPEYSGRSTSTEPSKRPMFVENDEVANRDRILDVREIFPDGKLFWDDEQDNDDDDEMEGKRLHSGIG